MSPLLLFIVLVLAAAFCAMLAMELLLRVLMAEPPADDAIGQIRPETAWVPSLAVWRRVRGWFADKPPQLTYRRDARGRFRSVRR